MVDPGDDHWGWLEGDTMFVPGPTYHSGPINHLISGIVRGRHVVLMRKFDALEAVKLIREFRPHWALFVPTMMNRIVKLPEALLAETDFSCFKRVWHSAAACPPWLKQRWIELVGPDQLWEIFGGSESVAVTIISGTEWLQHRGSVGRAAIGDIRILDENGVPAKNGEIGEIYMRNLNSERRFKVIGSHTQRMHDDWEGYGDLGWIDDDGYIYLADRRVDMINSGGQNIYPAEVESAIQSFPGVGDAAVFGMEDPELGEVVCALVYVEHGEVSQAALSRHLESQLTRYKLPRVLTFTDEPIRNDAGKVRKSDLRGMANLRAGEI